MPILSLDLLEAWLGGIVFVFGTIRIAIVSCAGIAIFSLAGLRAAPMMLVLRLLLRVGGVLHCLIAIAFFGGVHHIYISYDEVAFQRPIGGGSYSSPASSSILSMSSELKSSTLVKSSTVAIKWVVGGQ